MYRELPMLHNRSYCRCCLMSGSDEVVRDRQELWGRGFGPGPGCAQTTDVNAASTWSHIYQWSSRTKCSAAKHVDLQTCMYYHYFLWGLWVYFYMNLIVTSLSLANTSNKDVFFFNILHHICVDLEWTPLHISCTTFSGHVLLVSCLLKMVFIFLL